MLSYSGLKTTLTWGFLRFNGLDTQGRQLVIALYLLHINCCELLKNDATDLKLNF